MDPTAPGSQPRGSIIGYLWIVIALALLTGVFTTVEYVKEVRALKLDLKPQESQLWAVDVSTALSLLIEKRPSYPKPRTSRLPSLLHPTNTEFQHYRDLYKATSAARKDAVAGVILQGTPAQGVYKRLTQKLDPKKDALELRMWDDLLIQKKVDKADVQPFLALAKKLDVEPWNDGLIFGIYAAAGDRAKADEVWGRLRNRIINVSAKIVTFVMCAVVVGLLGLVLLIIFLVRHFTSLAKSSPLWQTNGPALIKGFLVYFIGFNLLSAMAGLLLGGTPYKESGIVRLSAVLAVQFLSCWLGVVVYMASKRAAEEEARWRTAMAPELIPEPPPQDAETPEPPADAAPEPPDEPVVETVQESVVEPIPPGPAPSMLPFKLDSNAVKWGVGGFCAAIVVAGLSAVVTNVIALMFGVELVSPEHPIVEKLGSGPVAITLAIIAAAVAAPITEEIAFRGLLFGSLRSKYGFWVSAVISSAVFAIIHPTIPVQFLGLTVLGVTFCVLREKTGSLAAPMVAHGVNNLIMLIAQLTILRPW